MVDIVSEVTYPLDPTGEAVSNRVGPERHTLTSKDWSEFNIIIPRATPFFQPKTGQLKLTHYPSGRILERGKDWVEGWYFRSAADRIGRHIFGCIVMIDPRMTGEVEIDKYQTLGGEYTLNKQKLEEILAQQLFNPFRRYWEVIAGLPQIFPPLDHGHPVDDMTGLPEFIKALNGIENAIIAMSEGGDLPAHVNDFNNPHRVTALHVKLEKLMNWAVATLADIKVGSMNPQAYMNPTITYEMIKATAIAALQAHIMDHSNVHEVTADQVNTYTKERITELLNQLLRGELGDIDADLLQGETSNQIIARAKLQTDAAISVVKQEIINDLSSIIENAQAQDTQKFAGWTKEQWESHIVDLAGVPPFAKFYDPVVIIPANGSAPIQHDIPTYTHLGDISASWWDGTKWVAKNETVFFTLSGGGAKGSNNTGTIEGIFSCDAPAQMKLTQKGLDPFVPKIYIKPVSKDVNGVATPVVEVWAYGPVERRAMTILVGSAETFDPSAGGTVTDEDEWVSTGSTQIQVAPAVADRERVVVNPGWIDLAATGSSSVQTWNIVTALGGATAAAGWNISHPLVDVMVLDDDTTSLTYNKYISGVVASTVSVDQTSGEVTIYNNSGRPRRFRITVRVRRNGF